MAKIMEFFATELDEFTGNYEKEQWDVTFRGEEYPPRIVMEQATPPLYKIEEDGKRTIEPNPTVQIYAGTQGDRSGKQPGELIF